MNPKKKSEKSSFTSFRILGEKAQKLIAKAREMNKRELQENGATTPPPLDDDVPEVIVKLSIGSVVEATFAILAIAFGVLLLYFLQDKIVLLLLAIFLAAIIDPGVNALKRLGVPRGIGILIHYFVFLFLLIFLLVSLIPIIAEQLISLAKLMSDQINNFLLHPAISLPLLPEKVNLTLTNLAETTLRNQSINQFTDAMQSFGQNLSTAAQGSLLFAAHVAGSVLNFFLNLILVLVLAFFIQIEKVKIISWTRSFLPWGARTYVDDKSEVINFKLGQWARGQLLLCASIGLLVFLALTILRMPYALTLAILAAFTEFIPVIGPFIAAVPAILIAMTQHSFVWALILACIYYVIQWCENNLLVPLIMKRAVGLSPIAIMFAMLVGISFPGIINPILGIMLSIPVTTILALFLEDWREIRMRKRSKA